MISYILLNYYYQVRSREDVEIFREWQKSYHKVKLLIIIIIIIILSFNRKYMQYKLYKDIADNIYQENKN